MIIDIHSHLDFYPKKKLISVIENAKKNRVKYIIVNSVNLKSLKKIFELSKKYSLIKIAAGLYPEKDLNSKKYLEFEKFVIENKKEIVAIGEIGMDFTEKLNKKIQEEIFKKQLKLAEELKLPVIIHTRKAEKEVLEILEDYPKLEKILHCFMGNFNLIKKANEMRCYFSIPTSVVRSEHFQRMVAELPRNKIFTETDTPFLSPYKDIRENESAFIIESIKKISEIWKVSEKEVEEIIENNSNIF